MPLRRDSIDLPDGVGVGVFLLRQVFLFYVIRVGFFLGGAETRLIYI